MPPTLLAEALAYCQPYTDESLRLEALNMDHDAPLTDLAYNLALTEWHSRHPMAPRFLAEMRLRCVLALRQGVTHDPL